MKIRLIYIAVSFLFISSLSAQISRGELEKQTSKGLALMKKGKIEDAVGVFNDILTKDPTEGKALLLRARAKYELGAYKGAKKDCFGYMDLYGIDDEVAGLLGKTEKALENYKQALAYLKTALMFDPDGIDYLLDRADIYYNLGLDEQSCADWHTAMLNGSEVAKEKSERHCRQVRVPIDDVRTQRPSQSEKTDDNSMPDEVASDRENVESIPPSREDVPMNNNEEDNSNTEEDNSTDDEEPTDDPIDDEEEYVQDDKIEEIFVDDELTIIIADGIGSRKLTEMPDILILSDKSGEVVVNVCVDRLGRVVQTELNEKYSTLKAPSLVSLALRESANFRFARASRKNHCGTITFVVTGSN